MTLLRIITCVVALAGGTLAAAATGGVDITVTPPVTGGFVVKSSAGNAERLRVLETGDVFLPNLPNTAEAGNLACYDGASGRLGKCAAAALVGGPQGLQGIQGIQGVPGAQGPAGAAGPAGPAGADGAQGVQGVQGIQGPAGVAATAGASMVVHQITGNLATVPVLADPTPMAFSSVQRLGTFVANPLNTRFTVPESGLYRVKYVIKLRDNSVLVARFFRNSDVIAELVDDQLAIGRGRLEGESLVDLAAGDEVGVEFSQFLGGLNLLAKSVSTLIIERAN